MGQQEESNAYWRAVSPMSALQGYNLACCGNTGSRYHSSCVPERPCRKVLAITVNHGGAGLFAWLLFALNQLMYAEKHNFVPFIDFGPCTLPGHGTGTRNRYFDIS